MFAVFSFGDLQNLNLPFAGFLLPNAFFSEAVHFFPDLMRIFPHVVQFLLSTLQFLQTEYNFCYVIHKIRLADAFFLHSDIRDRGAENKFQRKS